MKKLKIILLFSLTIVLINTFYIVNNNIYKSKYDINTNNVIGYVQDYKIKNNKLTIELKGKEKVLAIFYLKDNETIDIKYGDYLKLTGSFKVPDKNTNFNLFNYKNYLKSKKIYYIFEIKKIEKVKNNKKITFTLKNKIIKRINKINNKYLNVFILGDSTTLEDEVLDSYRNNGISHLFAISGMHITLFSSILIMILNKIIKNKKLNNIIIILFLFFYMFLTNFTPSIIRASFLFILLSLNKMFKLKIETLYVLIFILQILLLYNPYYIYNNGFLLSFITTATLIIFNKAIHNCNNYLLKTFVISLMCFLITIPICINSYYQINLLSPFINLIFVPLISLIIFPFSLIVFLIPNLSFILNIMTSILEQLSIIFYNINSFTLILKKISIIVMIFYYIIIIFILKKIEGQKFKYLILIILILLIHSNINKLNNYPIITMIDVGQGDSILIQLPKDKNILIDTGGKSLYNKDYNMAKNIIIPYLKSIGVKKLNYLILTHGDYDHMGESINLVNDFKVEKIILNCGNFNDLEKELIKILYKKKISYYSCINKINVENNKLYFLNNTNYDNENDNSVVIYTKLNNYKFLFMGDAGIKVENNLLEKYNLDNIDVLKVGHHGSNTSSSKEFINNINPKYSLISVGKNNRYGHPNANVLDNLSNSQIYRTDKNGSIMIKIKNNKLKIKTCTS